MILEAAVLNVRSGEEHAFEQAFRTASPLIAAAPGYLGHQLQRCLETKGRYLLLVQWETLESHTIGFRQAANFLEWKALLHHFYDPFPVVEHYENLVELHSSQA
ncbi:MAG: antibiotic biosynthesis monooxygenase [Silvibacterium sp.]